MKTICQYCGWEISEAEWYNKEYGKKVNCICDNCLVDKITEKMKEGNNA